MKILHSLTELPRGILTIGTFDGVHLGHQARLKTVRDQAQQRGLPSILLSFENHPSTVLRPDRPTPLLCTKEHKIALLQNQVDVMLLTPFTHSFAAQSYVDFLSKLPIKKLILSSDVRLGKGREGDATAIAALGRQLGFETEFLSDYVIVDGERISSSLIRDYVRQGNFTQASKLLGRPYSIYTKISEGLAHVEGLCLPPASVYAVQLQHRGCQYAAEAHLKFEKGVPLLQIRLNKLNFEEEIVEITFSAS